MEVDGVSVQNNFFLFIMSISPCGVFSLVKISLLPEEEDHGGSFGCLKLNFNGCSFGHLRQLGSVDCLETSRGKL